MTNAVRDRTSRRPVSSRNAKHTMATRGYRRAAAPTDARAVALESSDAVEKEEHEIVVLRREHHQTEHLAGQRRSDRNVATPGSPDGALSPSPGQPVAWCGKIATKCQRQSRLSSADTAPRGQETLERLPHQRYEQPQWPLMGPGRHFGRSSSASRGRSSRSACSCSASSRRPSSPRGSATVGPISYGVTSVQSAPVPV